MRSVAQSSGTNEVLGHFYAQTQAAMHFGNTPTEQCHRPKFSFLNSLIFLDHFSFNINMKSVVTGWSYKCGNRGLVKYVVFFF